jgi:hypothetical protein
MPDVVKGDGTTEPFKPEKLVHSLMHAGAAAAVAERIAEDIRRTITDGMTTTEVYRRAFQLLKRVERPAAARYSMRRAILELGPTGFLFEDFVGELFKANSYRVEVGKVLPGKCVEHEVDVVASSPERCIGAELKFHNKIGYKTDVKVALYVKARFDDIASASGKCPLDEMWLITNTKFTSQAISYGQCAGLHLVGWSYPSRGNLGDMIRETGLYPVTALTTLTRAEKDRLMMQNTALCKHVIENAESLRAAGITEGKHRSVLEESRALCGPN